MELSHKLNLLRTGKLTVKQNVTNFLEKIKKENPQINAFIDIRPDLCLKRAEYLDKNRQKLKTKKLFGLCIAVKASINVKGYNISCGSKVLEDYKAPYNATVIKKIEDEGGIIIGITNCDEFCSGSSGETSAFGPTRNPRNPDLIPGGSSSGSAAAVAAGFCDVALGSDTGGSIRNPSSHCGVVGVKPTYSSVSRYGLIDLSMSLDQIGPLARNVSDAALLLSVISGKDRNDSTSQDSEKVNLKNLNNKDKKLTIGVLKVKGVDKKIQDLVEERISEVASNKGFDVKEVKIENIELAVETYYPLVYVEFFSATRRLDGRRYGKKIEDASGPEVLRRVLGGSEISKEEYHGRHYHLALKSKSLIIKEFEKAFKKFDCIISPTVPKLPHKIGEKISVEEMYSYDLLTAPSNLAENCAVSVPAGEVDGVPVGMQIVCDKFQEEKMLRIAKGFERG
ncbi:MAG: Asp-tRNA(Asn)/Glu-tRNA(Gln) amidotransferase subunit GatA [Candidatus Pacearchaeota archaeon]